MFLGMILSGAMFFYLVFKEIEKYCYFTYMELMELIIFADFLKELLQQLSKLANFRHLEPSYRFARPN